MLLPLLLSLFLAALSLARTLPRRSPPYPPLFTLPLPISPTKIPLYTHTPVSGIPHQFYSISISPIFQQIFPSLPATPLLGYDSLVPGPTFRIPRNHAVVVRYINTSDRNVSVHLHGSYTRAPWDGFSLDSVGPGMFKDYYYPGGLMAPRTMWYHDHTLGETARNTAVGLKGVSIVEGEEEERGLPIGEFDVPLVLDSQFFTADAEVADTEGEKTSWYGDTYTVNGVIAPFLAVQKTRYRFRILNASVSRTFNITISDDSGKTLPMWVVGSDGGRMEAVQTRSLVLAVAERWEVVVDFKEVVGNVTMATSRVWVDEEYEGTRRELLQFRMEEKAGIYAEGVWPLEKREEEVLEREVDAAAETVDKTFFFNRAIGRPWTINGKTFAELPNRILENVPFGTTQTWLLKGAGGWSHPVHLHMADMTVLSRTYGNANQRPGRKYLEDYEKHAVKDVVALGENEAVLVKVRFVPWPGVYMFHCHNFIHADFAMSAAINISFLNSEKLYPEIVTGLEDPRDVRFGAEEWDGRELGEVEIRGVLERFAELGAYAGMEV